MEDNYKVCFIIANKYIKGYVSFVDYYVENINKFYKDSLILIVDNNSVYFDELIEKIKKVNNNLTIALTNTSGCKFELGAYKFGMKFLIQNNLLDKYDYYICTQDTYVLTNKFDFNNFIENKTFACPIKCYINDTFNRHSDTFNTPLVKLILNRLNLQNNINDLRLCWANSFVIHKSKIEEFLHITNDIITINKYHACECERLFGAIIYKLNNYKNTQIEDMYDYEDIWNNNMNAKKPKLYTIDVPNIETKNIFTKKITDKNERTVDII